jgi:CheY-like chemotaxis protein
MNLVVNARDAMPRGGTLTLGTRRAVLDAATAARAACPPGTYAGLLVHDTGTGIPPEIRQRIFEPFFTTKASGKGTGLGLSTVLGIVQQHHGGIVMESEPDQGTSFTIYLPLAPVETDAPATVATQPADPVATPATILVVEDDDSVRTIVDHTLRLHRYHVAAVRSAAEGLARLAQDGPPIDLVLSDVVMPGGISGAQLAEEVAIRWPGLPVILMSGFARELEQSERRILQKPFSIAQLLSYVQEGLAQRKPPPR